MADRAADRHRERLPAQQPVRQRRPHDVGAVPRDSWILARDADRARRAVLVQLQGAPGRRAALAGPVDQPAARHRSCARARSGSGGVHRADVALVSARGHPRGLRAHRAGQGAAGGAGGHAARAPERAAAGGDAVGNPHGLRAGRLGSGGAGVRRARARPLAGRRGDRAGHDRGAESRPALLGDLRVRQRRRRPELRVARPADSLSRAAARRGAGAPPFEASP